MDEGSAADRFRQHEDILRSLAAMLAAQHEKNQSYDTIIQEQQAMNRRSADLHRQQAEISQDIKTTLARVETLLARMLRHETNGTEA